LTESGWVIFAGKEHSKNKFDMTKNDPAYSGFANKTQIVGIWDDHDYGTGNGIESSIHFKIFAF
jgi:hypothetical protein